MMRELPPDTNRRSGRSTRQADEIIQELFEKETVFFMDHFGIAGATASLAIKIKNRMALEHKHRTIYGSSYADGWYGMTIME